MMIKRREFLGQLALGGALLISPLGSRLLFAAEPARKKKLVLVFQRGACDALSVIPPVGDDTYYRLRPSIALQKKDCLPLNGPFGLHPSLRALEAAWKEQDLQFIHQFGSPDRNRSHFDSQDYMETGTPGFKGTVDGFLSRALVATVKPSRTPLRSVALQSSLPRMLQGDANAVSLRSLKDFQGGGNRGDVLSFEALYEGAVDQVFRGVGDDAFSSIRKVREKAKPEQFSFPKGDLPKKLGEIASLFAADLGVEVAVTECGGWDTHAGQGALEGNLARRLQELGDGLAAFREAMKKEKLWADTLVLVITEFGRTARENGTRGTDHGHGSVAMVMGGGKGGRILHKWKNLRDENLFEARDLPVLHDFRDLLGEALVRQLGLSSGKLAEVFPGHKFRSLGCFS